jgi:hypothetical protein
VEVHGQADVGDELMATQLSVQKPTALTITPTANPSDATGNYVTVAAADRVQIRFANTSGGAITVTFDDPTSVAPEGSSGFNPDAAIVVPATTGVRYVCLFGARLARFRDPATGRINWTTSAQTGLATEVTGY